MKKALISTILVMCIICSFGLSVFATNSPSMETRADGSTVYYNNDGTYTIEIDGYELTIQESTLKILDIGKVGLKPKVSNIKITIDGITEAEDKTVTKGTPLIINFELRIQS